jgi:hypothetical protein
MGATLRREHGTEHEDKHETSTLDPSSIVLDSLGMHSAAATSPAFELVDFPQEPRRDMQGEAYPDTLKGKIRDLVA